MKTTAAEHEKMYRVYQHQADTERVCAVSWRRNGDEAMAQECIRAADRNARKAREQRRLADRAAKGA